MPEFPPMQLYITLAIAISIAAIVSAFIRQLTADSASKKRMRFSLLGLLIFFGATWLHLCFYLFWQIVSADQSSIFDFDLVNRAFHLFALGGIGIMGSLLLWQMLMREIGGDVPVP